MLGFLKQMFFCSGADVMFWLIIDYKVYIHE